MQREQLKSKIHRAMITHADPDYEGSIEIPGDLMRAVDLWAQEKVLVASITGGARLETYVQTGPEGSGQIVMNGGAARLIGQGERVTIMAFTWSDRPVPARIILCSEKNEIIQQKQLGV
jgi:aspartate 1-decarboxylase